MLIRREAGPAGATTVELGLEQHDVGRIEVRVDGKTVTAANAATADQRIDFHGADAEAIARAMVNGKAMAIAGKGGNLASVSLKGSSAALRYVDAAQGRVDTVTAFAAAGSKPASVVPAAPALPHVKAVIPTVLPASTIGKAQRAALIKAAGCEGEESPGDGEFDVVALDKGRKLVLVPCGSGAYNAMTVPMLIGADGKATVAPFDGNPGFAGGDDGQLNLVNAGWDAKSGELSTFAKGRGVGDCGTGETYVWDGSRFRLIDAESMPECRGTTNWITIWRAIAD